MKKSVVIFCILIVAIQVSCQKKDYLKKEDIKATSAKTSFFYESLMLQNANGAFILHSSSSVEEVNKTPNASCKYEFMGTVAENIGDLPYIERGNFSIGNMSLSPNFVNEEYGYLYDLTNSTNQPSSLYGQQNVTFSLGNTVSGTLNIPSEIKMSTPYSANSSILHKTGEVARWNTDSQNSNGVVIAAVGFDNSFGVQNKTYIVTEDDGEYALDDLLADLGDVFLVELTIYRGDGKVLEAADNYKYKFIAYSECHQTYELK